MKASTISNIEAIDNVLNNTDAFSDKDRLQYAKISAIEMVRLEKERDETIKSISNATFAIVFFY